MSQPIPAAAEAAIQQALRELATAPKFRGAVLLYVGPDGQGLSIKSTLPQQLAEAAILEAAAFIRGERGSRIVVAR